MKAAPVKAVVRTITFPARAAFDGYLRFERLEVKVYQNLFFRGIEVIAGGALNEEEKQEARDFADKFFDDVYTTARVKFGITNEKALASIA